MKKTNSLKKSQEFFFDFLGNHYFVLLKKQSNPTKLLTLGVEVALVEVCVKTVGTDFSGNIHRKCPIFSPDLHLPDWMTTSPHPDHSTGPKPIQLVQVVFTID